MGREKCKKNLNFEAVKRLGQESKLLGRKETASTHFCNSDPSFFLCISIIAYDLNLIENWQTQFLFKDVTRYCMYYFVLENRCMLLSSGLFLLVVVALKKRIYKIPVSKISIFIIS